MGYTIGKTFGFSASHRLPGLPTGHKCARDHGHNYLVEVVLTADVLTAPGFVTDFGDLTPFRDYVDSVFDHRCLNDVMDVPPTCENLAAHFADWVTTNLEPLIPGRLVSVQVAETATTWARYTVERMT